MSNIKLNQLLHTLPHLLGIALIAVGIIGFLPDGHHILSIHAHHVTGFHNLIHLFSGIGLVFIGFTNSNFRKIYLTLMASLYLAMIILGVALGGNIFNVVFAFRDDHFLHFGITILCIWFGYFSPFTSQKPIYKS